MDEIERLLDAAVRAFDDEQYNLALSGVIAAVRLLAARPGEGDWLVIEWQRGDTVIRRVGGEFRLYEIKGGGGALKFSTFADGARGAGLIMERLSLPWLNRSRWLLGGTAALSFVVFLVRDLEVGWAALSVAQAAFWYVLDLEIDLRRASEEPRG
jgi:hypothetical protein